MIPVAPHRPHSLRSFVDFVPLILSDNIPARSFALLTHRLCSLRSQSPLAYIIARLCLASLRSWESRESIQLC